MKRQDELKRLRNYLEQFTQCEKRINDFQRLAAGITLRLGDLSAADKEKLSEIEDRIREERNQMVLKCENVVDILALLPAESIERQVLEYRYILDWSIPQIAKATNYSYGYCANVHSTALHKLLNKKAVKTAIKTYKKE